MSHGCCTNALSIDVEGFVESNRESFHIPPDQFDPNAERREIEANMDYTLDLFDRLGVKATFFILGRIGRDLPGVVKKTAASGHEVGCHGFQHERIYNLDRKAFRDGIRYSIKLLQDLSGQRVAGFRAPDFSITKDSLWALDELHEAGFLYDSSVYPTGLHDAYGIAGANTEIGRLQNGLIEVPMSAVSVMGKQIPFCGGGYFRLYPVGLTKALIRRTNSKGRPAVIYLHPYELGPVIPDIRGMSLLRRFRHYYNTSTGTARLTRLLDGVKVGPMADILRERGMI